MELLVPYRFLLAASPMKEMLRTLRLANSCDMDVLSAAIDGILALRRRAVVQCRLPLEQWNLLCRVGSMMSENVAETFLEYLLHPDWSLAPMWAEEDAVAAIVDCYQTTGGATFSLYFGRQAGQPLYVVGLDNNLTKYPAPSDNIRREAGSTAGATLGFLERAIARYLVTHRRLLRNPRCCVGVWAVTVGAGLKRIFLDVSVLVYDEEIAQAFGREGNQIAIFSLQDGQEIDVGGTGESVEERLARLARQDRPVRVEGGS